MIALLNWRFWTPFASQELLLRHAEWGRVSAIVLAWLCGFIALVCFAPMGLFWVQTMIIGNIHLNGGEFLAVFALCLALCAIGCGVFRLCSGCSDNYFLLEPLSAHPEQCEIALALIARSAKCRGYRDAVLDDGRQLFLGDVAKMVSIHAAERQAVIDQRTAHHCKMAHSLPIATDQ